MYRTIRIFVKRIGILYNRVKNYTRKLLLPLYLFPFKLITYSLYYILRFIIKLILTIFMMIVDTLVYPFRSLRNLIESIFAIVAILYLFTSLFVIIDYLYKEYGSPYKIFCDYGVKENLIASTVRIVGGYSEGSGFFIESNKVITNFHVIADEPSPKIILSNGTVILTTEVVGNSQADLAVLTTEEHYPDYVLPVNENLTLDMGETVFSAGYPLGTSLSGNATVLEGDFIDYRYAKGSQTGHLQTSISLVEGMSGGPLTDKCGSVVGINQIGLAGISLYIKNQDADYLSKNMDDSEIAKISVDPSLSPVEGVRAFYMYLKARRMEEGYDLLSSEYKKRTDYEEWVSRFNDILDVTVITVQQEEGSDSIVFVKFMTRNWVDEEVEEHYYEGTWETVEENGIYKIVKGSIKEVEPSGWDWFW